jgi:hypothetical protein
MEPLQEEKLKQNLLEVLVYYNQQGVSLGTEFYVLKDVFNEFTKTYEQFIKQETEKIKNQNEEKQEEVENE